MEFVIGGTAAMGACLFTNPLEVLKTRLQLQGELKAKGQHAIHYKNVFHAGYVVLRNDGMLGLQKGLVPALWVQLIMNGTRLGVFDWANSRGLLKDKNGRIVFFQSVLVTGVGATIGQYLCNPFFLVKTHMQAQAASQIAVGFQHNHEGSWKALKIIYEGYGVRGLFRGGAASVPRAFVGGSAQLISFEYAKQLIQSYGITEHFLLKSFLGSMVGGVSLTIAMTPFDLILTRLYNQPTDEKGKGLLYRNYGDCIVRIYKTEGILAFYKGIGPMYLRLGPHTVLCLVFWDILKNVYDKYFLTNPENL
ncbi:solute carrier family 25 member 35-like [Cylas formicarius]|uniref:solute carrier family 25 member 35-like n=1 Tax=Cylas formicarius TaxID=197179 RepID=UPI0029583BE0|nr:solute carrier family 25 member 35-like [Cylas formicarius]